MASNIISSTIDNTFPIAGVDNDNQGFRDNSTIIKTALTTASSEITALQANSAITNGTTNFNNNTIQNVNLKSSTIEANTTSMLGETSITATWTNSQYYRLTSINSNLAVTISGWPETGKYAEMIIHFSGNGSGTQAVTFSSLGATTQLTDDSGAFTGRAINVNASADRSTVVKAFTSDNGVTVFYQHIDTFIPA